MPASLLLNRWRQHAVSWSTAQGVVTGLQALSLAGLLSSSGAIAEQHSDKEEQRLSESSQAAHSCALCFGPAAEYGERFGDHAQNGTDRLPT